MPGKWKDRLLVIAFFLGAGLAVHSVAIVETSLYDMSVKQVLSFCVYSGLVFMLGWWLSANRFREIIEEHKRRQAEEIKKARLKCDADLLRVRQYARGTWVEINRTFRKDLERNLTSFYFQFVCIVICHVYRNYPYLLFEPVIGQTVIKTATEGVLDTGLHDRDAILKRAELSAKRIAQFNDVNDLVEHHWIKQPMARIRQITTATQD